MRVGGHEVALGGHVQGNRSGDRGGQPTREDCRADSLVLPVGDKEAVMSIVLVDEQVPDVVQQRRDNKCGFSAVAFSERGRL